MQKKYILDSIGISLFLDDLPHTAALCQVGRALHPRGIYGWFRRWLWWRLFPAQRQVLCCERDRLQQLVQQELLSAVLEFATWIPGSKSNE